MDPALVVLIPVGIMVLCFILYATALRKDRDYFKTHSESADSEIIYMARQIDDGVERCEQMKKVVETELADLKEQVDQFKRERNPDAMFPSMEGTIEEANVIASYRMLQRVYKKLP